MVNPVICTRAPTPQLNKIEMILKKKKKNLSKNREEASLQPRDSVQKNKTR